MEVKTREHARELFANHKATIRVNTEDIMVIEWRNQNGSSNYYVQYIFDAKRGMLAISGDLGDCISCWYNPLTFKNLVKYVQNIEYWMGKFQTSSDSFTYEWSNIEDDLIGIKEEYIKNKADYAFDNISDEEIEEDIEEIRNILSEQEYEGRFPQDAIDIIEKYDQDWWDGGEWTRLGKRISQRVYEWSEGLKMAYEQIMTLTEDETDLFNTLIGCEISTYTCCYGPGKAVVTTSNLAKLLNWSKYKIKKIIKNLVFKGYVEYTTQARPAIESNTENGYELICEAMPPANGYAISKNGFETKMFKDACKEFDDSLRKWAEDRE